MLQPNFWPLPPPVVLVRFSWVKYFKCCPSFCASLCFAKVFTLLFLNADVPFLHFLPVSCLLNAGSVPKVLLYTSAASEDFTPPYHLHLRMGNGCYHSVFFSTLWLCCQGSSHRHVPKEWIHSRGFSLLYYKIPISIVLWCFVTLFQEKLYFNKSMRQYLYFELCLLSFQVSPGENEDVGIFSGK